jgi:hypothetical protein
MLIASLNMGDPVRITVDGRAHDVTVQRREGLDVYKHPDGRTVTVGYGPGRWNTEVSAERIAAGYVTVERLPHTPCSFCGAPVVYQVVPIDGGPFTSHEYPAGAGSDHLTTWCATCGPRHRS